MTRMPLKRVGFKPRTTGLAPGKPLGRRSSIQPGGTLKRSILAPASQKTKDERPQRQAVIALVHERDDEQCQAAELVPSVPCSGRLDVHEIYTRARFPGSHLHPDLCVCLCRGHHCYVTTHPVEAQALGLVKWSWEGLPDQPYDQDAE